MTLQEKGATVGLLTEKTKREPLPSDEEIDRLLRKRSSPTRRRKCSNMVSSLTKSWKQMENEQKLSKDEGGLAEERKKESRDAGTEKPDGEDAPTCVINISEDIDNSEEETVRIRRPQVST